MVEGHGPTWGDFQGIMHLSVALNAAYAALYSFVDDILTKERNKAISLLRSLQDIPRKSRARVILSRCHRFEMELSRFNSAFLRPASAALCLIGVIFLIFSSFNFDKPISTGWAELVCVLLVPFFLSLTLYSIIGVFVHYASKIGRRLANAPRQGGALRNG
jgi:hypothetical protein